MRAGLCAESRALAMSCVTVSDGGQQPVVRVGVHVDSEFLARGRERERERERERDDIDYDIHYDIIGQSFDIAACRIVVVSP